LTVVLASFLAPRHWREGAKTLRAFENAQPPSRQIADELVGLRPALPRGARLLFIADPFPKDQYFLLFLVRLLYHDMSITVDRAPDGRGSNTGRERYDAVFAFRQDRLVDAMGP